MTNQIIEKSVTVTDPRGGEPFAVTVQLEVNLSDCNCSPRTPSLGNPVGWAAK